MFEINITKEECSDELFNELCNAYLRYPGHLSIQTICAQIAKEVYDKGESLQKLLQNNIRNTPRFVTLMKIQGFTEENLTIFIQEIIDRTKTDREEKISKMNTERLNTLEKLKNMNLDGFSYYKLNRIYSAFTSKDEI